MQRLPACQVTNVSYLLRWVERMDADVLRLILIAAGAVFVAGLFVWERGKRRQPAVPGFRRTEERKKQRGTDPAAEEDVLGWPAEEPPNIDRELDALRGIVAEERTERSDRTERPERGSGSKRPREREGRSPAPKVAAPAPDTVTPLPEKFIQLNVVALAGRPFKGAAVLEAAEQAGLKPGPMNIFHRHGEGAESGAILYSMASMVEPGSFPLEDLAAFSTPGLTLFMRLPGAYDGLAVFSDMLMTAQQLAARLDGELQDETHSVLTRQTVEHVRGEIVEYRRRLQLARRKA